MKKYGTRIFVFLLLVSLTAIGIHTFHPKLIPNAFAAVATEPEQTDLETRNEFQCEEYTTHAWRLNDSVHQYLEHSYLNGMGGTLNFAREIQSKVDSGKLVPIENNHLYLLDTLFYSYPFLTQHGANLLIEIGTRFQEKLKNTDLKDTKIVVSSVLRTVSSVSRLRKRNRNAIRHSAHLHGTTFDLAYDEFSNPKIPVFSVSEIEYLKEMLAQSIFELREEQRCWATYEMWQACFHVVSR